MIPFLKKIHGFAPIRLIGLPLVCSSFGPQGFSEWVGELGEVGTLHAAGEGQVDFGVKIPSREPNGSKIKAKYGLTYSGAYLALSGGGEDYLQADTLDSHLRTYSLALHFLKDRSLQRLSLGTFDLSPLWHRPYDIPSDYRMLYSRSDKGIVYELIYLSGVQLSLAAAQRPDRSGRIPVDHKLGTVAKLAWQWPGQESSRFGSGWELGPDGNYEGLSLLFQNQGFNNQVFSVEWIRKKSLPDLFLLSNILSSNAQFDSKVVLAATSKNLWQISLERWTRLWIRLGWSLGMDLKRTPEDGVHVGAAAGIGGKL